MDGYGNPLLLRLSPGNTADISVAQAMLDTFELNGKTVICDKGYDSDRLADYIVQRGGYVVIPSRCTAKTPRDTDWHLYKERHLVENLFLKMKNRRRFATRYEKSADSFLAVSLLAAILVWLS